MTSKAELTELVQHTVEHVTNMLIKERHKSLMPMFHLIAPPGGPDSQGSAIVGTPWSNNFEKQLAVAKVKQMAREMDAQAVVYSTEAWMVKLDPPLTPWHARRQAERLRTIIPAEEPDRVEAVQIIAMNKAGDVEARTLQIVRDKPGGRVISLIPEAESPGTYHSWIFNGMFKDAE